jgi:carboxymethylenebutenolidase
VCEHCVMCVGHDAELPALPPGHQAAVSERLILEAADGNGFNAFAAEPAEPTGAAVLVLPDVRGLFKFYEDLSCRFAAEGHRSIAIDYFGRTAGTEERDSDFPHMDHIPRTTSQGMNADIAAAVKYLRSDDPDVRIYTVGFCFGGNISWAAATQKDHALAGAIGFYGRPDADRPTGDGPIWDRCHLIECRVLALFGGDDPGIPPENISRLDTALQDAGADHVVVTYAGAPHSFFDRSQGQFSAESLDAWNRVTEFIR